MRVTLQELTVKIHMQKSRLQLTLELPSLVLLMGLRSPSRFQMTSRRHKPGSDRSRNARRHSRFLSRATRVQSGTKQKAYSFQKGVKNAFKLVSRIGTHLAGRRKANSLNKTLTTPLMTPMLWTVCSLCLYMMQKTPTLRYSHNRPLALSCRLTIRAMLSPCSQMHCLSILVTEWLLSDRTLSWLTARMKHLVCRK